jgi:hypothetical protein
MGIHVPETLLRVSEEIKVKVRLDRITDRQIKNIVRQVKSGYVPLYANSATAHITRHIVNTFDVPCVKWSSWRIQTRKLTQTHPLWDAIPQAVAMSKLETSAEDMQWYQKDFDQVLDMISDRTKDVSLSHYMFRETGSAILRNASKSASIPDDHPVHEYLDSLTNRKFDYIELGDLQ